MQSERIAENVIGKAETEFGIMYYNKNDKYIGSEYQRGDHWDAPVIKNILLPYIQNAKIILDIGAHIGSHTIAYASLNPNATIYSFEMQQEMFSLLNMNVQSNHLEQRCKIFNNAIGNENKTVEMDTDDPISESAYSVFNYFANPVNNERYNFEGLSLGKGGNQTQMITIDSLELDGCNFIKIDVEGFEYAVILGAIKTIIKYKPVIYYEKNSRIMTAKMCNIANLPYRSPDIYSVDKLLMCVGYNNFTTIGENILASIII
jgi:FkbM family methyltransferase